MRIGLAYELGSYERLFDEKKTEGRKSRDIAPLRKNLILIVEACFLIKKVMLF
jgi:hypothetical protein